MEHIAYAIGKDSTEVRLTNMRTDDNDLPELIEELKIDADYDNRAKAIVQFNQDNRWKKKTIRTGVMSFPVEFYGNYSAMLSIYRGDGTVTVTTGGIEMGQGVNTKAAQVCAYELGIPVECVSVLPHYSFTAANNVFSGSSIVSESVCYSIIKACQTLKDRLEPIKKKLENPSWKELIAKAGEEEVDLTAIYMMTEKEKDLDSYSAFAVAMMEVELDVLTGRYEILRVDILEDVGLSANPNIDVGQVGIPNYNTGTCDFSSMLFLSAITQNQPICPSNLNLFTFRNICLSSGMQMSPCDIYDVKLKVES